MAVNTMEVQKMEEMIPVFMPDCSALENVRYIMIVIRRLMKDRLTGAPRLALYST